HYAHGERDAAYTLYHQYVAEQTAEVKSERAWKKELLLQRIMTKVCNGVGVSTSGNNPDMADVERMGNLRTFAFISHKREDRQQRRGDRDRGDRQQRHRH